MAGTESLDEGRGLRRVGGGLLAAAALALGVAAIYLSRERTLLLRGQAGRGEVVHVETRRDGSKALFVPRVRFPAGGAMHLVTAQPTDEEPQLGDGAEVVFDPQDPDHAVVDDALSLWRPALVPLALALFFLSLGVALLLAGRPGDPTAAR